MRLDVMQRDNFTCRLCGDAKTTLNIHHTEYSKGEPWEIDIDTLFTVCEHCHTEIEFLKTSDGKKVTPTDFNSGKFLIYKSIGWADKTRIMFISYYWKKSLRVISFDNECIVAFELSDDEELKLIAKILTINLLT